eukprot:PhF_6_TR22592/c0_g1_i8/m.32234
MGNLQPLPVFVDIEIAHYLPWIECARLLTISSSVKQRFENEDLYWSYLYYARFPKCLSAVQYPDETVRSTVKYLLRKTRRHWNFRPCMHCGLCDETMLHHRYECMHCEGQYVCPGCVDSHCSTHVLVRLGGDHVLEHTLFDYDPMKCSKCSASTPCLTNYMWHNITIKGNVDLVCKHCFEEEKRCQFVPVVMQPVPLITADQVGMNPRGAGCDVRLYGCLRGCRGINWKSTSRWGFDCCENCMDVITSREKSVLESHNGFM